MKKHLVLTLAFLATAGLARAQGIGGQPLAGGGGAGVASINGTAGAFTFSGSGVSCATTTCTFSGGTAPFSATPSVVFNTSTIASRNAVSADIVTVLNTSPTTTIAAALLPASIFADTRLRMFGQCSGGTGFTSAYATPSTAAPAPGCVDATGNPVGYLSYLAAQPAAQFTTDTFIAPANFLGADIHFTFYSSATTGNVALTIASGCLALGASPATVTYGSPQTVITNVSGTPNVLITTATVTNIAQAGVNGCAANSQVIYKVSRSISDTAAAPALLVNGVLTVRRSS